MRKHSIENIVIVALLAAGVLLSLFQFLYNRSLWLDEASLALNIINRNAFDLLKPLDYEQVAPILFLQIEKLFSTILPNTEYGLRIFPLLCFWASIYFFYKIVKIQLNNTYAIIIALSLFVFNGMLIYYSSEIKQYMTDVLVLLTLFYLVQKDYKKEKNKFYIMGIIGALAIFLSNVAPIILLTCGLYLLYDEFFITKRRRIMPLSVVFAGWLSVFLVYYIFFIYGHPTKEFMERFWTGAFLPHNSFKDAFLFLKHAKNVILELLFPHKSWIHFLLLIIGILYTVRRRKMFFVIIVSTPILLHLFLSTFHLYPFAHRFSLYVLPCIILVYSAGFECIMEILFADLNIKKFRLLAVIIPVFVFPQFSLKFPFALSETRESIKYIKENIREDESVYIYHYTIPTYKYYKQIGLLNIEVPKIEGKYVWQEIYKSPGIDELDSLHGKNWLLIDNTDVDDQTILLNRMDSLGHVKLKEFRTLASSAYLYDFGE